MQNFYQWIQLREAEVIDPNVWNPEMFDPPFKPPLQATSLDQIPPNYLKDNSTYISAKQHANFAYMTVDNHFMNNFWKNQAMPKDGEEFYKAKALDDQARKSANHGIPYLKKHDVYKGDRQEKIDIEEFDKIFKYSDELKQLETDNNSTAYDEFMMARRLLYKVLDEYKKSGYGHAVRLQQPSKI